MPFVTETIWQEIDSNSMLMVEQYPDSKVYDKLVKKAKLQTADFDLVKNIITAIRNIRAEYQIKPAQKIKVILHAGKKAELLKAQSEIIKNLFTRIDILEIEVSGDKPGQAAMAAVQGVEIIVPLAELIDIAKEKDRISKRIDELQKLAKGIDAKLGNDAFKKNAPAAIITKENEKLAAYLDEAERLKKQSENLK